MTQVVDWFGRKFEFCFPVELYPDLCMRLRGTPARIETSGHYLGDDPGIRRMSSATNEQK